MVLDKMLNEFWKEIHAFTTFGSCIQPIAITKSENYNFAVKFKCNDDYHVVIYHDKRVDVYSSDCTFDTILESDFRFHTKLLSRILNHKFDTFGLSKFDLAKCNERFELLDRLFKQSQDSRSIIVRDLPIQVFNEYIKI